MALKSFARRICRNRRGSIGVLMALFLTVSVGCCAIAVDIASLYLERRTAQGVADLAAIAAAGDIVRAQEAAHATLAANGFSAIRSLDVIKGRYEMDPALSHERRFEAGKQPFNAVRLNVAMGGQLYFAKSFMPEPEISVSAIGTADAQATFSIGSRLASVQGGLSNAILGALLGGNVSLSVMDYQALLNGNVSLLSFLSALSTEVGVTAGTYSDVLNANATVGQVLSALAKAAASSGQSQAAQVATVLLGQANASVTVPLHSLVDLGPLAQAAVGQPQAGLAADVNAMSLVTALASLANGNKQVAVNLGTTIPGLLSLKVDIAIGEAAQHSGWVAVGQPGAIVRTAQTRLRLLAEVGGSGILSGVRIRLPLYLEIASAEARLKSLACTGGASNAQATVEARPAAARAWIGDVAPGGLSSFGSSVPVTSGTIVQALLVKVTGSAYTQMSNTSATDLTFTMSDVNGHVIKSAEVRDFLSSLTSHLLQTMDLHVDILGLGVGLSVSAVKGVVLAALTPVTSTLDALLVPLLQLVGVRLGEVDVQVNGIRCGGAVLAG